MKTFLKISVCILLACCLIFFVNAQEAFCEISPGQTVTVSLSGYDTAILKFTPAVSDRYCFTSISDYDTVGFVYDEDFNVLAVDEASGESSNFLIRYDFTAGNTYYLAARQSADGFSVSFDVKLFSESHVHSYKTEITRNPTCDTEGIKRLVCECSDEKTETIPALGHNFKTTRTTATCTSAGKSVLVCQTCGLTETKDVSALGHNYSEKTVVDKEPTCTAQGSKSNHCTRCGKKSNITSIPSLGHEFSKSFTVDKKPTCTAQGKKSRHCVRCSKTTDETSIAANGHSYGKYQTTKNPTCTAKGEKVKTCSVCKAQKKDSVDALGHAYSSKYTIDKKPTCTAQGKKSRHCVRCSKTTDETSIAANGHSYGKFKTTKNPTCTAKGEKTKTCSVCKAQKKDYINALGHAYSSKYTTDKKATTDSAGYKSRHCTRCGNKTDKITIAKINKLILSAVFFVYNGKDKKPTLTISDSKGAKLKAGKDYDAKFPKASKSIGSYSVTVTLKGNYSGKKTLTYKIIPPDVPSLTAKQTSTSVTLSWKKVSGGVKYRVYKYYLKTKQYTTIANTSKTSLKINNLKSGTDYIFAVRAYKTIGEKTYISKNFTQVVTATVPNGVSLKAKKSVGGAQLSWKTTSCSGYIIYMSESKNSGYKQIKKISDGSTNSYYKSNLSSSKKYYFKIRTYKKAGDKILYSKFSAPIPAG
ncbi:MAG: fibronectin type III domain-containing protein [Acutalibacteraceae bacterium]